MSVGVEREVGRGDYLAGLLTLTGCCFRCCLGSNVKIETALLVRSGRQRLESVLHVLLGPLAENGLIRISDVDPGPKVSPAVRAFDWGIIHMALGQFDSIS